MKKERNRSKKIINRKKYSLIFTVYLYVKQNNHLFILIAGMNNMHYIRH
jgi:hypothetical protein